MERTSGEDGSRKNRAQEDSSGNNGVTDSMLQQHEYTKSAQSKADHTENANTLMRKAYLPMSLKITLKSQIYTLTVLCR